MNIILGFVLALGLILSSVEVFGICAILALLSSPSFWNRLLAVVILWNLTTVFELVNDFLRWLGGDNG